MVASLKKRGRAMIRSWEILEKKKERDYKIFSLWEEKARNPRNGAVRDIVVLDFPEWISVIPVTAEGNVVMVRQYRHGVNEVLLEIPGGLMDKNDPSPETAARRELQEETGYTTDTFTLIGSLYPQPAVQSNRYHIFLAENAVKTSEINFDEGEDLETVLVPLKRIPKMIKNGEIRHAMVVTAFYYLSLHKGELDCKR